MTKHYGRATGKGAYQGDRILTLAVSGSAAGFLSTRFMRLKSRMVRGAGAETAGDFLDCGCPEGAY